MSRSCAALSWAAPPARFPSQPTRSVVAAWPPSESAVVLLILACASVGAVVTSIDTRRSPPALLLALMLAAGQAIGHATLTIASDHQHGLLLSLPMLAAHIAAVGVCAVLIRGAERGYVVAASTVAAIVAVLLRPWAAEPSPFAARTRYRAKVVLRQLLTSGLGTRGPPAFV